jgi:hypothetical protein
MREQQGPAPMRNGTKGQAMRLPKGLLAFEKDKEQE